jgi:hypothetical protein
MRSRFAMLLAIAAVCVTTAWADWTPEVLVTSDNAGRSLYTNNGRKLAFASDGVGHVIWSGSGGIGGNRYDPASGWSSDYQVTQAGDAPSIALDADGTTIHAVWQNASWSGISYRRCVRKADGTDEWGPIVPLYQLGSVFEPAVASVPGEPNHVVVCWWREFTTSGKRGQLVNAIGFIECIDGVWGTAILLDQAGMRRCPSIAVAPNGDVLIAYFANDDNGTGRQIYVKTRHNGVWGSTVDVTPGMGSDKCNFPAIEVNPFTSNPHVVFNWMRVTQISKKVNDTTSAAYHTYRSTQGIWQTPGPISVPRHGGGSGVLSYHPTIAFVGDGEAYAAWCEDFPAASHGVLYSYCSGEGGMWSAPAWLTSDPSGNYMDELPHIAADEYAQTVHAVWDRGTEIWWRSNYLGGGGPPAQPTALSQSRVELCPNPAKAGRVTVQYSLPRAEQLSVTLLDVTGRAVKTQEVAAGRNGSVSIDVSDLTAGVYVARLVAGDLTVSKSLVVGR